MKLKTQYSNNFAAPPIQSKDNINAPITPQINKQNECVAIEINNNNYNNNNYNNNYNNNIQYYNSAQNNGVNINKTGKDSQENKININVTGTAVIEYHFFENYDLTSKFLMKVYGIVCFEFIIIFGFVMIFQINSIKEYFLDNSGVFWGLMGVSLLFYLIILIIFECNPKLLGSVPCNYITLFLSAIALAIICALIGCVYEFKAVCGAVTAVIAICLGIFCIGLFDKGSNLKCYIIFLVSLLFLGIHYGLMAAIFRTDYLIFLYVTCCVVIYSFYISFDILIIKETFSLDDYILASIILTLDIVRLFIFLLKLFGNSGNGK